MLKLGLFCTIFWQTLASRNEVDAAKPASEPGHLEKVLKRVKRGGMPFDYGHKVSPFDLIQPDRYDDFLNHKLIKLDNIFPEIIVWRTIQLKWSKIERFKGTAIPVTWCQKCETDSPCSLVSRGVIKIPEIDVSQAGMSIYLMNRMLGNLYSPNLTYDNYFNSLYKVLPGKNERLIFVPFMVRLTAEIEFCTLERPFYWKWNERNYECESFMVNHTTPVISRTDLTEILGVWFLEPCNAKDL